VHLHLYSVWQNMTHPSNPVVPHYSNQTAAKCNIHTRQLRHCWQRLCLLMIHLASNSQQSWFFLKHWFIAIHLTGRDCSVHFVCKTVKYTSSHTSYTLLHCRSPVSHTLDAGITAIYRSVGQSLCLPAPQDFVGAKFNCPHAIADGN